MRVKERLTVTVDSELIEAGNKAVAGGETSSLSAWVNLALEERVTRERRLRALTQAVSSFEKSFGEITEEELSAQRRSDRRHAVTSRLKNK